MKLKFPLIAAFVAMLTLTACGGGSDSSNEIAVSSPATLTKTDNTVGTGAEAAAGKSVTVDYTLWLYSDKAADFKGTRLESGPYTFTIGSTNTIQGFQQGVLGMKVGGKRTILVPSSLGYGASGSNSVPPNSGLVFELVLKSVN